MNSDSLGRVEFQPDGSVSEAELRRAAQRLRDAGLAVPPKEEFRDVLNALGKQKLAALQHESEQRGLLPHGILPGKPRTQTLYHYTSTTHWPLIQKAGYLKVTESNIGEPGPEAQTHAEVQASNAHVGPDVVWLTDQPNLSYATARWAQDDSVVDRTKVRITVQVSDAIPWSTFARRHHIVNRWYQALSKDEGQYWYVVERPIPSSEWTEVRVGDVPVGKREIPRKRQESEQPLWQTERGEAVCDFCGIEQALACYRYECKPFELDGWQNGWPGHPGESDWAACWYCAELIQKRDIPALLARGQSGMKGQLVMPGGKHGTPDNFFSAEISEARVRAFFKHYTKRRRFIGKCDICSARGQSVRWQYACGTYRTRHPLTGIETVTDTPWCVCDACSSLIDRRKTKSLIDRALEHQLGKAEQNEGVVLTSAQRGLARQHMNRWIELFMQHKQAKQLLADLPKDERPIADIPAQAALNEKLTLLRWLEGSEGRTYIGNWNDDYQGKPFRDRSAQPDELAMWSLPLRYGEAYYWEANIAQAIEQSARELAENPDVPFKLQPQQLPSPQGFFYADVPFGVSEQHPCRAIGWTIAYDIQPMSDWRSNRTRSMEVTAPQYGGGDPSEASGVLLTFWSQRPHDRVLRPSGQMVWGFGTDFRQVTDYLDRDEGDPTVESRAEMFASMLAFIQQRIVVSTGRMGVSSATRKWVERDYPEHEPSVRVITLRRKQRLDYERPEEPTERQLTVRSRTRGHWRFQCFNTAHHAEAERDGVGCHDHQSIYIHPFWRGPADGRLIVRAGEVFDVAI